MLRGFCQEFRLWQACSQTALSHTHKTRLHFSCMFFFFNWNASMIGHREGTVRFLLRKKPAKVSCKLLSQ